MRNFKILAVALVILLTVSTASAYSYNETTDLVCMGFPEFDSMQSTITRPQYYYNISNNYNIVDPNYVNELAENYTRVKAQLIQREWLIAREYNNSVPIIVLQVYFNKTLDQSDMDALEGNLSGRHADNLYVMLIANNTVHYTTDVTNKSIVYRTDIMACEAVPEIKEALDNSSFDREAFGKSMDPKLDNNARVIVDNVEMNIDDVIDKWLPWIALIIFIFFILLGLIAFYCYEVFMMLCKSEIKVSDAPESVSPFEKTTKTIHNKAVGREVYTKRGDYLGNVASVLIDSQGQLSEIHVEKKDFKSTVLNNDIISIDAVITVK